MKRQGGSRIEAPKTPRMKYVVAVLAIALGVVGVVAEGSMIRRASSSCASYSSSARLS
jgi:hypothetical protein